LILAPPSSTGCVCRSQVSVKLPGTGARNNMGTKRFSPGKMMPVYRTKHRVNT